MALKSDYEAAILSELLLEKLKDGYIPTVESITEEYDALVLAKPELGEKPLFSLEDNSVVYYENSSAAKTNDSFDRFSKDIKILWDSIVETRERILKNSRRWSAYYESTKIYLDKLEDRIDTLLLMNSDTLGYYQYVSDDFATLDFVDMSLSTAAVNPKFGIVHIGQETSISTEGAVARIDLTALPEENFQFGVVDAQKLIRNTLATGSLLSNSVKDEYSYWLHYVETGDPGSVTVSLTIDLETARAVNKIDFSCNGATITSAFTISCMYNLGGVDYVLVPTDAHTQSTLDTVSWSFPTVDMGFVRFLITKSGADDKNGTQYIYEFGAKNIQLFESSFDISADHELYSTVRTVLDTDGNTVTFQKATLSVCEDVPENTSIHYFLGIDNSSIFFPVEPIERKDASSPYILDFTNAVLSTNLDSLLVFDSTKDSDSLDSDQVSASFALVGENDNILNWYIEAANIPSVQEDSIAVWRNVGDITATDTTVRSSPTGWVLDSTSGIYSTVVYISSDDGLTIDLGSSLLTVDGSTSSGIITISQGQHSVSTSSINWLNVEAELNTLESLREVDLLYPYNHKLLIEGYSYGSTYGEDRIYQGASRFAETILTYSTLHNFNTQTDTLDLNVYTRDVDDNGDMVFVFKVDKNFSDYQNERFLIEYNLANRTFSDVVFKAVLKTTDPRVTPSLSNYVVKLG